MLPTSLCRHTRHHEICLAPYSPQAHSGNVSATLEQRKTLHTCPYTPLHAPLRGPTAYCQTCGMRHEATAGSGLAAAVSASRAWPHPPSSLSGLAQHQRRPCGRRGAAQRRSCRRSSAPLDFVDVAPRAQPHSGTRLPRTPATRGNGRLGAGAPGMCREGREGSLALAHVSVLISAR